MSLMFRFRVAYEAFVHGKCLVDKPVYIQVMVPRDCRFTDDEIRKIFDGLHDEMTRVVNEANEKDRCDDSSNVRTVNIDDEIAYMT